MKKKDSIAKAENELLSFQQQLNENLAKNEESSSTSLPELFSETDKKVQPEKSNDNNNNNTSTEKKQLYENELLKILDSEEIKYDKEYNDTLTFSYIQINLTVIMIDIYNNNNKKKFFFFCLIFIYNFQKKKKKKKKKQLCIIIFKKYEYI